MTYVTPREYFGILWARFSDSFEDKDRNIYLASMRAIFNFLTQEERDGLIMLPGFLEYWHPHSELNQANLRELTLGEGNGETPQ